MKRNTIQITTNGTTRHIPKDEPVFLIRGQDAVGADAVRAWANLAEAAGADHGIVQQAREHADTMAAWPTHKVADFPVDEARRRSDTHEERYIHRKVQGHPLVKAITVFMRRPRDPQGHREWWTQAAFCIHADAFNRQRGRTEARRRYMLALQHVACTAPSVQIVKDRKEIEALSGLALVYRYDEWTDARGRVRRVLPTSVRVRITAKMPHPNDLQASLPPMGNSVMTALDQRIGG